ncbi:MAG TPA: hypothetical protein ENI85_05525 [Deltaproteobacteria bacterium]|nr:hypothetical protein [Deltaproteobacteria bacterium]
MRRSHPKSLIGLSCLAVFGLAVTARSDDREAPGPRLDPLEDFAAGSIARVVGTDPGAPRNLVLWLWDGAEFSRVAGTRSRRSGRFDFGIRTLPGEGGGFDVALEEQPPDPDRVVLAEPPLIAPMLVSGGPDFDHPIELVIAPAIPRGELRVYDRRTRRLLLRAPVDPHDRGRVTLDLAEHLARPWPETISIEQVLEDGRRSPGLIWRLAP